MALSAIEKSVNHYKKRGSSISHISHLSALGNFLTQGGPGLGIACCRVLRADYLSSRGRWLHLGKLLSVIFIPILGGWIFTLFSLVDNILEKDATVQAQIIMMRSINLGRLIYTIQQERDMSILYISSFDVGTKGFLLKAYEKTDEEFLGMWSWPQEFASHPTEYFRSRGNLMNHISDHRKRLNKNTADVYGEIVFYSDIVDFFMDRLIDRMIEAGFAQVWRTLVAFQKITRCMLDAGRERAYGVMFYGRGNFHDTQIFDNYFKTIYRFNYSYKSASQYSDIVKPINVLLADEQDSSTAIQNFREEIKHSQTSGNFTSANKAQNYYDSLSFRITYLQWIQEALASLAIRTINATVNEHVKKIITYSVTTVFVILFCPLITFASEALTRNMQTYSKLLMNASNKLNDEKTRTDTLVYQMLPKQVAERLKRSSKVDSEYFKSATVMFTSIVDFSILCMEYSPLQIVNLLNVLYSSIDENIGKYDVYKVETINDVYMVVSGVPKPNGTRHAAEIAYLALDIVRIARQDVLSTSCIQRTIRFQIGINTGAVSAGVVGTAMLRYCLFGDTVNTASRMRSYSQPNKIHISDSTFRMLSKTGSFNMTSRGFMQVKGKGEMNTYWLVGCTDKRSKQTAWTLPGELDSINESGSELSVHTTTSTPKGYRKSLEGRSRKISLNRAFQLGTSTILETQFSTDAPTPGTSTVHETQLSTDAPKPGINETQRSTDVLKPGTSAFY